MKSATTFTGGLRKPHEWGQTVKQRCYAARKPGLVTPEYQRPIFQGLGSITADDHFVTPDQIRLNLSN